jgi:uncharacterized protein YbjT (DUF2867 family)
MKIIVTGSSGNISRPLTQLLVQKGHTVTVVSSSPEKQQAIEALGAAAAIGAVEDTDFLTRTLQGADALYAMIPPNFTTADQRARYRQIGHSYARAIRATGVKRVVHLSSMGAHLDKGIGIILGSHDVEGILNELPGISLTHLRPGSFFYNLYGFIDSIKRRGYIRANYGGEDKTQLVAATDIAVAAAEELDAILPARPVRYILSDECSCNNIAAVLGKAIGKPDLQWITCSREEALADFKEKGIPDNTAAEIADIYDSIHNGAFEEDYYAHGPVVPGKIKLTDFAKEFAAVFNQGN